MKLTDKLISLRKESDLTQNDLAEKMEVSRQAISLWESGETLPSMDKLRRLSELYGVSMDYLMNDGAEWPTAAVAVMEKPGPEKPWRKPALVGVVIGFAIAVVTLFFWVTYHAGYDKGVKDATPTYPVHSEVIDVADIEGNADLFGW